MRFKLPVSVPARGGLGDCPPLLNTNISWFTCG